MIAAANRTIPNVPGYASGPPPSSFGTFETSSMSVATHNHGHHPTLPRIATQNINTADAGASLRTAPSGQGMGEFGFNTFNFGSTVNPAQLQLSDAAGPRSSGFGGPVSPFTPQPSIMEDDRDREWMPDLNQINFSSPQNPDFPASVQAGAGSSNFDPTQVGFDLSRNPFQNSGVTSAMVPPQYPCTSSLPTENGVSVPMQPFTSMPETISPSSLHAQAQSADMNYGIPSPMNPVSPSAVFPGVLGHFQNAPAFSPDGTSVSSTSMSGSARQSSVTSVSTDSITDVTRHALLASLAQPSGFGHGHRKYSQPSVSSPLSARDSTAGISLPSTSDLQRFVAAYIQYFHPHFPFLHVATLSFDTPAYTSNMRAANGNSGFAHGGIVGGGGCLILAMAAIGALYEFDRMASCELFEASKRMIKLYLEERRNTRPTASGGVRPSSECVAQNTPLWLVQAMLLNVIYGHNCGDKTAGDIASTHCAALVGLARSAELTRPLSDVNSADLGFNFCGPESGDSDVKMEGDFEGNELWGSGLQTQDKYMQWRRWISVEERKRTMFAIFHMSSLLVSAYNHAPALTNSEIQLDLPCDEELWTADSARTWAINRGCSPAEKDGIPFASALSTVLSASQSHSEQFRTMSYSHAFGSGMHLDEVPQSDLRPSTFGCLVLIDALHNYIWETRQRHSGCKWTVQETESMHAHIEPALRAWQAAWASNPTHSLERPNPFGLGPLSADSIPLLDLAYVRLFVNLGTSKEAFWQREFEGMAEELAKGSEIIQHADHVDAATENQNTATNSPAGNGNCNAIHMSQTPNGDMPAHQPQKASSKRERHLRKAAFYAADSLSMSDKLGVTFADFTSRELPIQSALCAFDCAQILAEWIATVQERVGRFLGILGRDSFNYTEVPAIMLLEDEDLKLLQKISGILQNAESKMIFEVNQSGINSAAAIALTNNLPSASQDGFGSKILKVTACMLERSAVWPGKCLLHCDGMVC